MADAIKSGAVQAFADEKKVQYAEIEHPDNWEDMTHSAPFFANPTIIWRPAPTPRLRPWRGGLEVPKQAIYRDKGWMVDCWSLILGASSAGIEVSRHDCVATIGFSNALKNGEYSLDGGKTWAPCGVQEGGE